jgi:hypothetical protein
MIKGSINVSAPSSAKLSCVICRDPFLESTARGLCVMLAYKNRKGSKLVVLL